MRVKEIDRTANFAWSPEKDYPIYMATGTAAQQLDATFSTSSALEIFALNLDEATLDMPVVASITSDVRYHKLLWGSQNDTSHGVLVGGAENGKIDIYNTDQVLAGNKDCLSTQLDRHVGAVKALDLNPFQSNLLASGAGDSEIYIWDLLKTESPMTPGQKSQPPEELACVAWNRQVQHILGSTFSSRCVVWDLRKNEPIIKISDSMSRIKAKLITWHPEVATQLCLSSEDDHTPVIQLWDLRYATSPLKVLESHQKGVLSMAWCHRDPDLLLSCGKDSRILCWNPNSNAPNGEVVYDLSTNNQWCFDVQWCLRNPSIISSASFDGHITLYSLMGGGHPVQPSNKVAESFGGAQMSGPAVHVPQEEEKVLPLQKPPKWIRKPVGATFAFGGKLVTFGLEKPANPQQPVSRTVTISQVVTETELVVRSSQLEQALGNRQFPEFCSMKAANSSDPMQESIWNFMRVNFEKEPRNEFLQLLGYDPNELARKVVEHTGTEVSASCSRGVDAQELAQKMSLLNTGSIMKAERLAASGQASPNVGSKTPVDSIDELSDGSTAFDDIAQKQSGVETPLVIPTDNVDGLMAQALLTGNFEAAVEMCISEDKMAEAILLAIAGGPELLIRTQKKYFQKNKSTLGRLISSVVTHDWGHIVESCDLDNWKEALAVILTYALSDEFAPLCDTLAHRLETERQGELSLYASLCYICSGNVDKFVDNWVANSDGSNSSLSLQDVVEKVMVLRKAVEMSRGSSPDISTGALADKLNQYAGLLAAQGNLSTALSYLGNSSDMNLAILQDRVNRALGVSSPLAGVPSPFEVLNILPEGARPQQQQQQQRQPQRNVGSNIGSAGSGTFASGYHQTQASGSNFNTSTTSTTNYYNPNQYSYNTPGSTPTTQTSSGYASSAHRGLSHKYPQYPKQETNMYGTGNDPYSSSTSTPQPNQFYQPSTNQPQPQPQPQPGIYNPTSQPNVYNPVSSYQNPTTVQPTPNLFNPSANLQPSPLQMSSSNATNPIQSYQEKSAECAWNDPPIVKEKPKPKQDSNAYNGMPQNVLTPQPGVSERGPPGAPSYPGLYNPAEHQPAPQPPSSYGSNVNYQGFNNNPTAPPNHLRPGTQTVQQTHQPKQAQAEPPKPVEKGPVPSDHQVLQDVLDKLVKSCSQVAPNAQMKRKLEDVTRKLEILYDKLRANALSQSVLSGLHQIVKAVQNYDYNGSISVYTGMVAQGNFSEISNFMPAIKVLLQAALQMQVYVQ